MLLEPEQRPEDNEQQKFLESLQEQQAALRVYLTMEQQFSVISQNQIIEKMSREQLVEFAKALVVQNYATRHMAMTIFSGEKSAVYPDIKLKP